MSEFDLPDFIDQDVLQDVAKVEVPDQAILRYFVKANKPFLGKSAVAEMTGLSDEGARKRLNSLVDRGVLLSAEAGKQTNIYWLNHPRSRWPVPGDIDTALPGETDRITETVVKINRLTTWALFYAGIFVSIYLLDWLSGLQTTDGVFELSLNVELMPFVAFLLLGVLFYIGLETSLIVENDDVGWPTVRRVYRKVVQ